jgi:hypothetical protein
MAVKDSNGMSDVMLLDFTACLEINETQHDSYERAIHHSFTSNVTESVKRTVISFFNPWVDRFRIIGTKILEYETKLDNDTITNRECVCLEFLRSTMDDLGFLSVREMQHVTYLELDDYPSKYVYACALYSRRTTSVICGVSNIANLYRQSLLHDMYRLSTTLVRGTNRIDWLYRCMAVRQCAIMLVHYAGDVLRNMLKNDHIDISYDRCTVCDRHIIQFAFLGLYDIHTVGFKRWRETIVDICCRYCSTVNARSPRISHEYYVFYRSLYIVYRYYIKIKSTWDLLAIDEGTDSIIVDVLTAIRAYKNSIRKDYGLERWKSPFKEMTIESINMLDTTPDSIKRDSNLLEMLRNIISTYYDVCTNKLEEQYRRRHQMTYIPRRRTNVTNSAII